MSAAMRIVGVLMLWGVGGCMPAGSAGSASTNRAGGDGVNRDTVSAARGAPSSSGQRIIRLYTAADQVNEVGQQIHSNLLQPTSLDTIEVFSFDALTDTRLYRATFPLSELDENLEDVPVAGAYRIVVRGYRVNQSGGDELVAYGAAVGTLDDDVDTIAVQMGRAGCVGLSEPSPIRAVNGEADMVEPRYGASVTPLPDGRVMIAGGSGRLDENGAPNDLSRSVEFYDPVDAVFTRAVFELPMPLAFHTASALPNGKILFAGGLSTQGTASNASADIFVLDPATGAIEPVAPVSGSFFQARFRHEALALPDGDILLVGGETSEGAVLGSTFRYFAQTGVLTEQGALQLPRTAYALTPIARGETELAIAIGGRDTDGQPIKLVETFSVNPSGAQCPDGASPSTQRGCWIVVMNLTVPRWGHSAVALKGGSDILVAGGFTTDDESSPTASLELIRSDFKGMNGQVGVPFNVGQLSSARGFMSAAVTTDGVNDIAIFSGGFDSNSAVATFERIEYRATANETPSVLVSPLPANCQQVGLPEHRWGTSSVRLKNDTVLIVGGALSKNLTTTRRAELFFPPYATLSP